MSCRIVNRGRERSATPVVWPVLGGNGEPEYIEISTSVVPSGPAAPASSPSRDVPEQVLTELHQRIVDLESALQRDVRQARESGYQDGLKAGQQKASKEVDTTVERLSKAIADIGGLRMRLRREAESDLVALAVAIARRVIRRELSVDPDAIQGIVKAALDKIQARELCRVRIHPEQAKSVQQHLTRAGIAGVQLVEDASLKSGDVILETKRGDLDASIDSQLSEIERGFADRIAR